MRNYKRIRDIAKLTAKTDEDVIADIKDKQHSRESLWVFGFTAGALYLEKIYNDSLKNAKTQIET